MDKKPIVYAADVREFPKNKLQRIMIQTEDGQYHVYSGAPTLKDKEEIINFHVYAPEDMPADMHFEVIDNG